MPLGPRGQLPRAMSAANSDPVSATSLPRVECGGQFLWPRTVDRYPVLLGWTEWYTPPSWALLGGVRWQRDGSWKMSQQSWRPEPAPPPPAWEPPWELGSSLRGWQGWTQSPLPAQTRIGASAHGGLLLGVAWVQLSLQAALDHPGASGSPCSPSRALREGQGGSAEIIEL